jgi:phage terminase large subunit-like protein
VIYNPAAIICEVNGFAEILGNNIANKNPNTNVIKFTSKSDKLERIRCLITPWLYKNGIKIKDCPMGRTLFSQFQQFPTSAKDDGLDSISLNIGAFNYITHKTTEVYNNIRYT